MSSLHKLTQQKSTSSTTATTTATTTRITTTTNCLLLIIFMIPKDLTCSEPKVFSLPEHLLFFWMAQERDFLFLYFARGVT